MTRTVVSALAVCLIGLVAADSFFPAAHAQNPAHFEQARKRMVEEVIIGVGDQGRAGDQGDAGDCPRTNSSMPKYRREAYFDMAFPIGDKQTISPPFIVAYMTEPLDPQPTDKVLEIGTGSGYQAAVLSPLVKEVYTIEIVESLGKSAADARSSGSKYKNVVHQSRRRLSRLARARARSTKSSSPARPRKCPSPLIDQLKEGGSMVVPVGERYQQTLYSLPQEGRQAGSRDAAAHAVRAHDRQGRRSPQGQARPGQTRSSSTAASKKKPTQRGPARLVLRTACEVGGRREAPDGKHYVSFTNDEPGRLPPICCKAFAIDGRKVKQLKVSARVMTKNVVRGADDNEQCYILFTLYDDQRRDLGMQVMGPFLGTSDWHEETRTFDIPITAREGIFRIGLFGATGFAAYDKISIKKVEGKK